MHTQNETELNITIILSLYSAIELCLLELKPTSKFKERYLYNAAITSIKNIDKVVKKNIVIGSIDDFEENTGEIYSIISSEISDEKLKAYTMYKIIQKLHEKTNHILTTCQNKNVIDSVKLAESNLHKLFKYIIEPNEINININPIEENIYNLFSTEAK